MKGIFTVSLKFNENGDPVVWISNPVPDRYRPLVENMVSLVRGYFASLKAASDEEMHRALSKRKEELLKEIYSYDDPFCPDVRIRIEEIGFLNEKIESS